MGWNVSVLVVCLMAVLLAEIKSSPVEPKYNEIEQMVLEDLKAHKESRGLSDVLDTPKCWFEDFTGACCIKMRYRTGKKDKKGKDIYGKHRACVEAGIDFTALKAFVRAVYDGKILGREIGYKFGEICWPLPEPLNQLNVCIWLWHVEINVKEKVAEACFLFSFTKLVHIKIDCLRWENGTFSRHNRVLPKKDQAIFTLYMSEKGVKIEIKNNYLIKIWKSLKKVWEKISGLFGKSKDMASWVKKTYD